MKIVLVEPQSNDATFLIRAIHARTAASIEQACSRPEGISRVIEARGTIDLVIFTSLTPPEDMVRFAEDLREYCDRTIIRMPSMIALVSASTTLPSAAKLQDMHIPVRLRSAMEEVCFDVAVMLYRMRIGNGRPLWGIRHCQGRYGLFVRGAVQEARICVGPRVVRLARLLSGGLDAYTVEEIAERLGICRQSVKKYIRDLRHAYDAARADVGVFEPGSSVVWMRRGGGGTLCGLHAGIVWG